MFALTAPWIIDIKLFHDNFIFVQDQRWNAEKPSADLDPLLSTLKHYYVDLSSWYEFWFALIFYIDINVILDLSTKYYRNPTIL